MMQGNSPQLLTKFTGSFIGSALGDAIGQTVVGRLDQVKLWSTLSLVETLAYQEATATAIVLAETIINQPTLDPQTLGDALYRSYQRAPWRGHAIGLPALFNLVQDQGLPYQQAAAQLRRGGTADAGAATRITPLALAAVTAPDLYAQVTRAASVTHAHPVAIDGAAVLAKAIATLALLPPVAPFPWQPWLQALIAFAQTREVREQLQSAARLFADHVAPRLAFDYLHRSQGVQHTLAAAIYAFMAQPTCFECCLIEALAAGEERAALGTMAGALAGAYLGLEAIPSPWRDKLENGRYLLALADRLATKAGMSSQPARPATSWLGQWN